MRNGRLDYGKIKAYASNVLSTWTPQDRRQIFSYAYDMIEEIVKTYDMSNGNGSDKLNGVFKSKLEGLRSNGGVNQAKKLALISISDESPVVRKVAFALLIGLATEIANSKETPSQEEIQLAYDVFSFVISYVGDADITRVDEGILARIQKDTYSIALRTLTNLYPTVPEYNDLVERWDNTIKNISLQLF